jgi:hypothetical protein
MSGPQPNGSPKTQAPTDEVAHRAHELYDRLIRPTVEPSHNGEFLILNTQTGEYEMDADEVAATKRALSRFGGASLFTIRVGQPTAHRFGSHLQARRAC